MPQLGVQLDDPWKVQPMAMHWAQSLRKASHVAKPTWKGGGGGDGDGGDGATMRGQTGEPAFLAQYSSSVRPATQARHRALMAMQHSCALAARRRQSTAMRRTIGD